MTKRQIQHNAKKYMANLKRDLDNEIIRLINCGA